MTPLDEMRHAAEELGDPIARAAVALDAIPVSDIRCASDADLERLLFEAQAIAGRTLYEQQARRRASLTTEGGAEAVS